MESSRYVKCNSEAVRTLVKDEVIEEVIRALLRHPQMAEEGLNEALAINPLFIMERLTNAFLPRDAPIKHKYVTDLLGKLLTKEELCIIHAALVEQIDFV